MSRFRLSALTLLAAAALSATPRVAAAENLLNNGKNALVNIEDFLRRLMHLGTGQDDILSHAIAISSREATLELELAQGGSRTISLRGGKLYIDGQAAGNFSAGGALERSWRRALADGASLDTRALLVAMRAWRGPSLSGEEAATKTRLDAAMRGFEVRAAQPKSAASQARADREAEAAAREAGATVRLGDLAALDTISRQIDALDGAEDVGEALRSAPVRVGATRVNSGERVDGDLVVYKGSAEVFGEVTGSVVALFGDVNVHGGGRIGRDAVSVAGSVHADSGDIGGETRTFTREDLLAAGGSEIREAAAPVSAVDRVFTDVRNVVAVFVAFAMLGFGTVFFGRRYLEVVADTASHSFGRSFVVGLLGQLLLLPTFAMLIVGLVCTVVGILLLPFAAVAFIVAAILAVVGGYLAVAHSIGETVTRRRMAHGAFVRAPNAYGYLFAGLIGLLGLWAAAALTGWMGPVVIVFKIAAVIVTWLAVTTGFGAVLLSRAGLRETFAGRHIGEMSDEYLWATPPATPTAARMNQQK